MKIFVCEFVTGGGMTGGPLPTSLTREADLILRTLLTELSAVPGVELLTSRDPRLPPVPGIAALAPRTGESLLSLYHRGLDLVDAAWPTAPESGGALLQLAGATTERGRLLLGSRPEAVALTTSKRATVAHLERVGIPAVPTASTVAEIAERPGCWVIKPDDGAGCEETIVRESWQAARVSLATMPAGRFIAQPWIDGDSRSLSLLCRGGTARLLSVNRQRMERDGGRLRLAGLEVNALPDQDGQFQSLAHRIAWAVPSLWGYVGVDLINTSAGPVVLEINPRLTTSYCGLGQALGINVAQQVLALLDPSWPTEPAFAPCGAPVTLQLEVVGDG